MVGVEFGARDAAGRVRPDPELTSRVLAGALERGVILLRAGVAGNVFRTLVPLVIADDELEEALDVIVAAIAAATSEPPAAA
jgi:4-aminobutyrate aminotransferase/(S)-3-amino-2-methylpropionate transaminase